MIRLALILACWLAAPLALGGDTGSRNKLLDVYALSTDGNLETAPRLVVTASGDVELKRVSGALLPNRVYAIYHREQKAWIYALTNFSGKFEEPLELLYKGSVLPGALIGGKNPFDRFKLTEDYHWIPTKEQEEHLLLIPARPNVMKRVLYTVPPFDMTEIMRPPKE